MKNATPRSLTAAQRLTEDRRDTRGLRTPELTYLLGCIRLTGCSDRDQHQQAVTDAVLYYAAPGHEVPARATGGQNLSYYVLVKARNLFTDQLRASVAAKRGGTQAPLSLDAPHRFAGGDEGGFDVADPSGPPQGSYDADRLRTAVTEALAHVPEKLRLFELHLAGCTPAEITVALGWGCADAQGRVNSTRARKALFDTQSLLAKKLPALAALRLGDGPSWTPDDQVVRPGRHLSSRECQALAARVEGYPLSRRDAQRYQLAA
jgi:DNA-directed RNA polymerase specialized sigma24 family protein